MHSKYRDKTNQIAPSLTKNLLTLRPNSFSGTATSLSAFIFSAEVVLKKKEILVIKNAAIPRN